MDPPHVHERAVREPQTQSSLAEERVASQPKVVSNADSPYPSHRGRLEDHFCVEILATCSTVRHYSLPPTILFPRTSSFDCNYYFLIDTSTLIVIELS